VEVQEAALKSARAQLESVRARREEGVATEFDVLRARVDVSNIQAELIDQKSRLDSARARLMRVMGVSQRSRVSLETELEYQQAEAPSYFEAVRAAFTNRPDIYRAAINLDLQQEAVRNAYTNYFPNLEAYGWRLWAKPDPHEASNIQWDTQWQYGVRLNWRIFDGLAREGQIIQQQALARQRGIELADTEQQALQEVKDALAELESATELVESQKLNLRRADRALSLVQAGYREGVNTEVEVLDARTALTRARGLYHTALHRHTMARVVLQRAMGLLGPRPGADAVPEEAPPLGSVADGWEPKERNPKGGMKE
jgi:outer membrane protein TolC